MSKVLITIEVKDNTTDNNLLWFTTVLSKMNVQCRVMKASCVRSSDIEWCDVYIANRPNSIYSQKIVHSAKESGRYVIVSLDDDIVNLPPQHSALWKRRYTLNCLKEGDSLISPNPLILEDYCTRYNLRPILSTSFVNENEIKRKHSYSDKLRIVYSAGKDHVDLFNKYILPFFDNFIKRNSDKVDVTFIGVEPKVPHSDSVHFVKGMPYKDYLEYMYNHDFDIGLAPIDDNPFCARKFFVKYLEYSKYGILGLYSNVKPYVYAVNDGYNGLLVSDNSRDWERVLMMVLNNRGLISECVNNSQTDLKEHYSLDNAVAQLHESCLELEEYAREDMISPRLKRTPFSVTYYIMKDFLTRLIFHLKNDGLGFLLRPILHNHN